MSPKGRQNANQPIKLPGSTLFKESGLQHVLCTVKILKTFLCRKCGCGLEPSVGLMSDKPVVHVHFLWGFLFFVPTSNYLLMTFFEK